MAALDTVNGSDIDDADMGRDNPWRYLLTLALYAAGLLLLSQPPVGDYLSFIDDTVWVCPANHDIDSPAQINLADCERRHEKEINTYRKRAWVLGTVMPPAGLSDANQPIGLYLSARAASRFFLNDRLLGQNGQPGTDRHAETPGTFDAIFYVPKDTIVPGVNSVALLLSGQHSLVNVHPAILSFSFGPYREPPFHGRNSYWIALLTFGGFLIGAIYFAAAPGPGTSRLAATALSMGSALAAAQLLIETSRGLWAYPYPLHDLRQFLICTMSLGVGMALLTHTLASLNIPRPGLTFAMTVGVAVLGLLFVSGYDAKASWLMLVPSVTAGSAALFSTAADKKTRLSYAVAFTLFACLIVFDPKQFLDAYYYVILMTCMSVLFVHQARAYRAARRGQEASDTARLQLEAALADLTSSNAMFLTVSAAGKAEKIDCKDIAVVSAAGDYIVVRLLGGREIVQNESLKAIGAQLPKYFVAVHRAHRVNSRVLSGIKRQASGVGELQLIDGHTVPVSRRIFPKIKKTLFAD